MKKIKITILLFLVIISSIAADAWAYSLDNIVTSRTFNRTSVTVGGNIVVTFSSTNAESNTLRGFYYSENIPEDLTVTTQSVTLDGSTVSYVLETGTAGVLYPGANVYRWILETPTAFNETHPVFPSATIQIIYSLSSPLAGTFNLDEFSWAGYFPFTAGGTGATFGYSEPSDAQTVEFLSIVNDPPMAVSDAVSTPEDISVAIDVLLNDTDTEGDTLFVASITQGSYGTVVNNGSDVTFTPNTNFSGTDTFSYVASDGPNNSAPATVTVTVSPVNDPPVADSKSLVTDFNTPVPVTLTGSDVDLNPLTFTVVSGPSNGTLSGTSPNLLYAPVPDFEGTDSFTYRAYDQTAYSSPASVDIAVGIGEEIAFTECFLATAAFGSKDSNEVVVLRKFRDEVLSRSVLGRRFIGFYYRHSPPAAEWLTRHDTARTVVRALLKPVVTLCRIILT